MMIVDSHLDIAWNALAHGRGFGDEPAPGCLLSRRGLERAGYGLVFGSLFTAPRARRFLPDLPLAYRNAAEAHMMALCQVGFYRSLGIPIITTRQQLQDHRDGWRRGRLAMLLAFENADPIENPAQLGDWYEAGVRILGPAWSRTRYCGGTNAPGGLTTLGHELLRAMRRRRMVLDVSHMADRTLRDSLEAWTGPVVATHTGARALSPGQRQLPDDVIAEIGRREGILGVSMYSGHLRTAGRADISDVVAHVEHIARVAGDVAFVGVGSDLDGGFGRDRAAIDSLDDLAVLRSALARRFGRRAADGVMGSNWLRFLEAVLPA
jgi:membrane dipeptidase